MRSYLPDSPYINMGPLLIGQTVIFVIKEPKVKQMFLSLRTSPQVVLLGKYNLMVLLTFPPTVLGAVNGRHY